MSTIAIMESLGIPQKELDDLKKPFEAQGHIFYEYERTLDPDILIKEAATADVMILANMPMPAVVIRACSHLRFIDVAFTGVDHVGLDAAAEKGIAVSNASGYSNEAVAELVLGMALSLLRNLSAAETICRLGGTVQSKPGNAASSGESGTEDTKAAFRQTSLTGRELKGRTVGIIGLGRIGSRSAELFHAFGCPILAHSRTIHPDAPGYVRQVSLDELLRSSDIVVVHCPLNDTTRGMIDGQKLSLMKPSALLINAARGPVVVSKDLAMALNQGVIAGAGIDVFDKEPPLPADEPLLHCSNCLVTPHMAYATEESMTLRAQIVFENLRAWLAGKQQNIILP